MSRKRKASIQQIVEMTKRIAEQRRRINEQTATRQAALATVREREAFIPKPATESHEIKICF